jgi:hypothetical protein
MIILLLNTDDTNGPHPSAASRRLDTRPAFCLHTAPRCPCLWSSLGYSTPIKQGAANIWFEIAYMSCLACCLPACTFGEVCVRACAYSTQLPPPCLFPVCPLVSHRAALPLLRLSPPCGCCLRPSFPIASSSLGGSPHPDIGVGPFWVNDPAASRSACGDSRPRGRP